MLAASCAAHTITLRHVLLLIGICCSVFALKHCLMQTAILSRLCPRVKPYQQYTKLADSSGLTGNKIQCTPLPLTKLCIDTSALAAALRARVFAGGHDSYLLIHNPKNSPHLGPTVVP